MTNTRIRSRQQGFSLIELVIGMAIFLLVLLAVYQLFDTGSATYRSGQRKVDVQQNARVALDEVVRQLR
ncbi:MAG TPA: prepilin-type N-terminal cleavage/methylation domain-containing protein, partial [Candidatus Methylomirabilis sp.]